VVVQGLALTAIMVEKLFKKETTSATPHFYAM
jgi:hypothetical protein